MVPLFVMGDFERICEGVFRVGGGDLSDGVDCLVYALDLGDLVLIDCGAGSSWDRIRDNLEAAGLAPGELHTLLLTHAHVDHIGAAARIREETGCRVVAHAADTPAIASGDPEFTAAGAYGVRLRGVEVDQVVEADTEISFEQGRIRLLHTPGHTPGSLAAVYESGEEVVLFGQDIHGPFSPSFGSDLAAWRHSMHRLLELDADVLCEGHFGVFRPATAVRRFIQEHLDAPKSMIRL